MSTHHTTASPVLSDDRSQNLFGKPLAELRSIVSQLGYPAFRGRQLAEWLYRRNLYAFVACTSLSKRDRAELASRFTIARSPPTAVHVSKDGTKKYLFTGASGAVEAAYIPDSGRATLCLSTQIGCRWECRFCWTGRQGLQQNLSTAEILSQLSELPERVHVTNVVFMGMGEPLDNFEATRDAIEILTAEYGYGIGAGRLTVSTVGMLPELQYLLEQTRVRVALSVHSPFAEERAALMPVERHYPLAEILKTLQHDPRFTTRRRSVEYLVFGGSNDSDRHARALAQVARRIEARVNLIAVHGRKPGGPTENRAGAPGGFGPRLRALQTFCERLGSYGARVTVRRSRGEDIAAACGMLHTKRPPG